MRLGRHELDVGERAVVVGIVHAASLTDVEAAAERALSEGADAIAVDSASAAGALEAIAGHRDIPVWAAGGPSTVDVVTVTLAPTIDEMADQLRDIETLAAGGQTVAVVVPALDDDLGATVVAAAIVAGARVVLTGAVRRARRVADVLAAVAAARATGIVEVTPP